MLRILLLSSFLMLFLAGCGRFGESPEKHSGAGEAMDLWILIRAYPDGRIRSDRLYAAHRQLTRPAPWRGTPPEWEGLGPKNIGGRTLCLAFHPTQPAVIYAGSAGGGLWKTTTAGNGADAWTRIPTGYPVQAVGAIAIDPTDADIIYLGTGEVYNYTAAQPGIANRLTRGLYGFGILKSTDGGESWDLVLDWSQSDLTGVWEIVLNPDRPQTVYAATTEGVYRSYDAGESWSNIHALPAATDLALSPLDTNLLFAAHGGYQSPQQGVYRSTDGGDSFEPLDGIPDDFTGKTMLSLHPTAPGILYASVGDAFESRGLYRSTNSGNTWTLISEEDVAKWQGWYSHDVAVSPVDPNTLLWGGIDIWRSETGGTIVTPITSWSSWFFGQVPVGGPEGPPNYVHADIHGLYYHPALPNVVYAATDGGIFGSFDGGLTWTGRNGGYQTQQFYANFANSATNPDLAIGGMQDNSTAIYTGDDAWTRVIGGDGMCAAINPEDDGIIYGSSQNLNIRRSTDLGPFVFLPILSAEGESRTFNGPYELAPSAPEILYAGAQRLHRSLDRGDSWEATSTGLIDNGNPVLTIAVGPEDPALLYVSTAPFFTAPALLKSTDGGANWSAVNGSLPDRVVTDIAIDPVDPDLVYVTLSGFGSPHLYRSFDGGGSWEALGEGQLPDVPANSVLIDPLLPDHLFLGNDLGVFASLDGGGSWEFFSENLPDAALVMHLSLSADRQLRAATHGNGVWQAPLPQPVGTEEAVAAGVQLGQNYPNPVSVRTIIPLELTTGTDLELRLLDGHGRTLRVLTRGTFPSGQHAIEVDLSGLPAGVYHYVLEARAGARLVRPLVVGR